MPDDLGCSPCPAARSGDSLLEGAADLARLRALGHAMLDDVFDDLEGVAEGSVWRPMPEAVRAEFAAALPAAPVAAADAYAGYRGRVAPYAVGNRHPRFFGWVHGGGTALGVLAGLLEAGLNANCGGRDHAPVAVERQVVRWAAALFGMPADTSGLITTGTSMANLIAVLAARHGALPDARRAGVGAARLAAYASAGVHLCVARALDFAGIGSDALRLVSCDGLGGMRVRELEARIEADRAAGLVPFLVVGTAGTVDIGAIDDLASIADRCRRYGLWFHVDGAFGAMATLSPSLRPLLAGIERADSVAFDWHKLAQVPYDAGCVLVRDAAAHRAAFERAAPYLGRAPRGLAGGGTWPVDLGPELSRGFRALRVWLALQVHGPDALGAVVERCCELARLLGEWVAAEPRLELLAPVALNVVCFRHRWLDDAGQEALAADLQEAGGPVLSTTRVAGRTVLRAAVCNHRTAAADVEAVVREVLAAGARRAGGSGGGAGR